MLTMVTYIEELLQKAVKTARFAEEGFMTQVREIAEALSICPKSDVKVIAEQLMLAIEVMEDLEKDVKYYESKLEEEKAK